MVTRQSLLGEIDKLRQVLIKEWLKQAYFRKEKNIEFNLISDEFQDLDKIIKSQLSIQQKILNTSFHDFKAHPSIEPSELEEYTPRFLVHQSQKSDFSLSLSTMLKTIAGLKHLLQQSLENHNLMITSLTEQQNQPKDPDLLQKYDKEKEKVKKLTQKYNDLELDFLNLQELVDELSLDKEHGKPCESCENLREKIQELEETLKKQSSDEFLKFKEMYEDAKDAHNEIAEVLSSQPKNNYAVDQDIIEQVSLLQEKHRQLEEMNINLLKKFENESAQVLKLENLINEYQDEIKAKNTALDKAQTIIKKLNSECERLAKNLEKTGNEKENLKKENRSISKNKTAIEKKFSGIEVMKKTEERLREEIATLKNKHSQIFDQKDAQINQLNCMLFQQSQEKHNLEITLEELEQKLNEIDQINRQRNEEYTNCYEKINELKEILKKKDEELLKINKDIDLTLSNKDQEFQHLKRQAENMIRQLSSSESSIKAAKTSEKNRENNKKKISSASLAEQLEEAFNRENQLKSLINSLINNEAKELKESLSSLGKMEAVSRAETERWIMRNEELEQRVTELSEKTMKLFIVNNDFRKTLHYKNSQFDEYVRNSECLVRELQSKIDFLTVDLSSCYNLLSKEVFPFSQHMLNNGLSLSHEEIHKLRQDLNHFQSKIQQSDETIMELSRTIKALEEEKESISNLLYKSNASILYIDNYIGEVNSLHPCAPDCSFNLLDNENNSEITEKARIIINKLILLRSYEKKYVDRLIQNDFEIMQFKKSLKENLDQSSTMESSISKLQEENRYLTEIAYKEKEEKIKFKSMLSDQDDYSEKIKVLTGYIDELNNEKYLLEDNCVVLRSELDKSQWILARKSQQLEDVKENNFREISRLRNELESLLKESIVLDSKPKITYK